ncbi:MAG: DUF882 domain-containing protein [Bacteroidales bacterium]|nr:DUF882 domain-containing protein [Bacteroidales bacterium]
MLYFKMSELIHSDTAVRLNINNMPPIQALDYMLDVIYYVLNPAREHFGVPFIPTSGYRCSQLNTKVGGKSNSQHLKGQAVDFVVKGVNLHDVFIWMKNNLEYDQLLFERDSKGNIWIHVSFVRGKNRKQAIDNYKVK